MPDTNQFLIGSFRSLRLLTLNAYYKECTIIICVNTIYRSAVVLFSICVSVCNALTFESFNVESSFLVSSYMFGISLFCRHHRCHQQICSIVGPRTASSPPSSTTSQSYNLRNRAHSLQLSEHTTQLSDSNFLTLMLYKNTY